MGILGIFGGGGSTQPAPQPKPATNPNSATTETSGSGATGSTGTTEPGGGSQTTGSDSGTSTGTTAPQTSAGAKPVEPSRPAASPEFVSASVPRQSATVDDRPDDLSLSTSPLDGADLSVDAARAQALAVQAELRSASIVERLIAAAEAAPKVDLGLDASEKAGDDPFAAPEKTDVADPFAKDARFAQDAGVVKSFSDPKPEPALNQRS